MLQIWNNKYGLADIRDLKNFALNFYFKDFEDSSLLQYLNIKYNNKEQLMLDIKDGVACATFFNDVVISGKSNNGDEANKDNYIELEIKFETPDNIDLKSQDLKSLFVEIVTI